MSPSVKSRGEYPDEASFLTATVGVFAFLQPVVWFYCGSDVLEDYFLGPGLALLWGLSKLRWGLIAWSIAAACLAGILGLAAISEPIHIRLMF